jgi:hypothetical protein
MGLQRVEVIGADRAALPALKAAGMRTEIINYQTRLFIPAGDDGSRILGALIADHAITSIRRRAA